MKPLFYALFACLGLSLFFSCKKTAAPLSQDKEIDSFSVKQADARAFTVSDLQVVLVSGPGMDSIIVTIPFKITPGRLRKHSSI